jgi:hypothetical protein
LVISEAVPPVPYFGFLNAMDSDASWAAEAWGPLLRMYLVGRSRQLSTWFRLPDPSGEPKPGPEQRPHFQVPTCHWQHNINGIRASPCRHYTFHNTCLNHQISMQAARVSTSSWWPSLLSRRWNRYSALLFVHRAPTTLIGPRFSTPRQLSTMAANTSKSEDRIVAALGQYTT